jgi:hypothetical protein
MEEMTDLTRVRRDRTYLFKSRKGELRFAWIPFSQDYKVISYTRVQRGLDGWGEPIGVEEHIPEVSIHISNVDNFMEVIQKEVHMDNYANSRYRVYEFENEEKFEEYMNKYKMIEELVK